MPPRVTSIRRFALTACAVGLAVVLGPLAAGRAPAPLTAPQAEGATGPASTSPTARVSPLAGPLAGAAVLLRIGERPVPPPAWTLTGYRWPLPHGRLTQPFGPSRGGSRIVDGLEVHDGIDLATFCGDRIVAAHDGVVLRAGRHYDGSMGWQGDLEPYVRWLDQHAAWPTLPIVVVVDDGNGYRSVYGHLSRIVVAEGETVRAGQLLGYEGRTGLATGCHLHYTLFSPLEPTVWGVAPDLVARYGLPAYQTARVDPLIVLPPRLSPVPSGSTVGEGRALLVGDGLAPR